MKYKFRDIVQDYSYTCLEELRVDLMETMQYLEKTTHQNTYINIILSKDNAKKMYELLKDSEYKKVAFHLASDYPDDEELDADKVVITINSDSEIIIEELNMALLCGYDFLVIDKSIPEYEEITKRYTDDMDSSDYILRFTIE